MFVMVRMIPDQKHHQKSVRTLFSIQRYLNVQENPSNAVQVNKGLIKAQTAGTLREIVTFPAGGSMLHYQFFAFVV